MKTISRPGITLWLLLFCLPSLAAQIDKPPIIVFAAASLTNVLQEVGDDFTKDSSIPVKFSFAASSALARQIENGSPADVFFSADIEWMDYLQGRQLIQIPTRHDVVANHLVLVAPADSKIELKIGPNFPLATTLGANRLTTGDPDSVPVGPLCTRGPHKTRRLERCRERLVRADSVRSALAFVDRGEAALGIVYATDAGSIQKVRVVDVFPDNTHLPIVYPIALTAAAKPRRNQISSTTSERPVANATFKKYGFQPLH